MAKSVGMFQRPVEYKLNCLEMVYEFSGLQSNYLWIPESFVKASGVVNYSGFVELAVCFFKEESTIVIKPIFNVNVLYAADQYCGDFGDPMSIEYAHSLNKPMDQIVNLYYSIIDYVKQKLIDSGFNDEKINQSRFIFSLTPFRDRFYLASGSVFNEYDCQFNVPFEFVPDGYDSNGHTLWKSNLSAIEPFTITIDMDFKVSAFHTYAYSLIVDIPGLTVVN